MKTKERSIRELLIVLRDNKRYFTRGLCFLIDELRGYGKITSRESTLLIYFIKEHPTKYFECSLYYWPVGRWAPRRKFLDKWIKKLETK